MLLEYATMNKVGLLYLERSGEHGTLGKFENACIRERRKRHELLVTITRAAGLLRSGGIQYAVFKSIFPYPAIPNDVDILVFGESLEFRKATRILANAGFKVIRSSPRQISLHDTRNRKHIHINMKDVYDVDLYQDAAASYLVYLDKAKFINNVIEKWILGKQVKTLTAEAELLAMMTHSVIPEQIYTLSTFYTSIYTLARMSFAEINKLTLMAKESRVTCPARVHCSITTALHQAAFGSIPEKLRHILTNLGREKQEVEKLRKIDFKMPYRYSLSAIVRTFMEKSKEYKFRKSLANQMICMIDPRLAGWVFSNVAWRRTRSTY